MCDICQSNEINDLELGQIMTTGGISVHYFCLLLSTNLPQKGTDLGGILGFLIRDIRMEIKNAAERTCVYCKEKRASIKCAVCSDYFHLVCGVRKNCRFQFIDEFISFCHNHHGMVHKEPHKTEQICYICRKKMGKYNPITSITATCCSNFWLHINCLREYALSAGYYLKCLFCCDLKFRDEARRLGVFVPDRDARVEQEQGAFRELYERYSHCDALICQCEKENGRKYNIGKWKIVVCNSCGQSGIHTLCSPKLLPKTVFQCETCQSILNQTLVNMSINKNANEIFDTTLYLSKSQLLYEDDKPPDTDLLTSLEIQLPEVTVSVSRKSTNPIPSKSPEIEIGLPLDLGESTAKTCPKCQCQIMEEDIDEDLIHKLVADLMKHGRLHNEVISGTDDDDDSVQSAEELLEVMSLTKATVPLPIKDPQNKTNDAKCVTTSDRDACQLKLNYSSPPPNLDNEVITISDDDDDSVQSVEKLFEKMSRPKAEIPMPMIIPFQLSLNDSSSSLPQFVHCSPPSSKAIDELASFRLEHFFENFTDSPPPSD